MSVELLHRVHKVDYYITARFLLIDLIHPLMQLSELLAEQTKLLEEAVKTSESRAYF